MNLCIICNNKIFAVVSRIIHKCYRSNTRKPCYRKDDRAMRPIYGYPEKFRESSQPPPATTFPEICKGLFVPIDTKNVHTKLEVRIFIRS